MLPPLKRVDRMKDKTITLTNAQRLHLLKSVNSELRAAQNKVNVSADKLTRLYELQDKLGLVT